VAVGTIAILAAIVPTAARSSISVKAALSARLQSGRARALRVNRRNSGA